MSEPKRDNTGEYLVDNRASGVWVGLWLLFILTVFVSGLVVGMYAERSYNLDEIRWRCH